MVIILYSHKNVRFSPIDMKIEIEKDICKLYYWKLKISGYNLFKRNLLRNTKVTFTIYETNTPNFVYLSYKLSFNIIHKNRVKLLYKCKGSISPNFPNTLFVW